MSGPVFPKFKLMWPNQTMKMFLMKTNVETRLVYYYNTANRVDFAKDFGWKNCWVEKRFGTKKKLERNFCCWKYLAVKKIGVEKNLFVKEICWSTKNVGQQKNVGKKKIWLQKFLVKFLFGQNKCLVDKNFKWTSFFVQKKLLFK